jgi:hypothetical protein
MKRTAVVISLAALAGVAGAGPANHFEVTVNPSTREAFGSLYDARRSPDNVQFIGCSVSAMAGSAASATCDAKTAASVRQTCTSQNPEIVKAAQSLTDNGYIFFRCEPAPSNVMTYLYVSKNSLWLP